MSLINDMLRDLDARHAADSEKGNIAPQVRPLPQVRSYPWKGVSLALLAAATSGIGVWFFMRPLIVPPTPVAAPVPAQALQIQVPPMKVPPPAPEISEVSTTAASDTQPPQVAEVPVPAIGELKLDTRLTNVVVAEISAKPPLVKVAPEEKVQVPALQPKATVAAANGSVRSAQITKSPLNAVSTGHEQAEAEYRRGYTALRKLDVAEAISAFQSALKIEPEYATARQALLSLLVDQKRWQEAEALALDGVLLTPSRSDWAMVAARLEFEQGDIKTALTTLAQHAPQAQQNADYHVFNALLLQRVQRYTDAADSYRAALAVKPNEGRYWYGLGLVLDAAHQEDDARKAFERARDAGNLPNELASAVARRLR